MPLLGCSLLLAATTAVVWDYVAWTMPVSMARDVTPQTDEALRRAAVVSLLRESRMDVESLRRLADGAGQTAEQARLALAHLHEQTAPR